jgi:hypothetical protein
MKIILKIELEFESWFENEREPKTKEEWTNFFNQNLMPEGSVLGIDDGEFQDMILLESYHIECMEIS